MATFTQDKQPYGPLVRREYLIDGIEYAIVREHEKFPTFAGIRSRWALRRYVMGRPGATVVESTVSLSTDATIEEAEKRLIG